MNLLLRALNGCQRLFIGLAFLMIFLAGSHAATGQQPNPFQTQVRPTEPLTAQAQLKTFTVPEGFEIQLVAAEPQIAKPMNLAFDARGRLWVTDSVEYPFPAPADRPGRDSIKILEDTDGDQRYDRITTFAENLNIPIGLLPVARGAIVFSIPNIWYLEDTDDDGQADQRTLLYGPFGFERDTHGLNNAFRRHFDGWVYACHGFNNITDVAGSDGQRVSMQSGNTYRISLDGQHIEQFTWGQVNPFGMAVDSWGNLFTADCHSKPIYQLLRNGYYPSFGKPHQGLGFVPPMMDHLHGSTAIAGIALYEDDRFPEPYRNNAFSGNVMTSRVNRNRLEYHGSTIHAVEQPDMVSTTDPWFRPVDVRLGPDGALYIADFYNRIIGHYEVPLDHPGRDRHRGRIWRVVHKHGHHVFPPDMTQCSLPQLLDLLGSANLTTRLLATHEMVDRFPREAPEALADADGEPAHPWQKLHQLWILSRLGAADPRFSERLTAATRDSSPQVRTHAFRILSESVWQGWEAALCYDGLQDAHGFVQRAAADALGQHPDAPHVPQLLAALAQCPNDDTHLSYTIRVALRECLQVPEIAQSIHWRETPQRDRRPLARIAATVPHAEAGRFLFEGLLLDATLSEEETVDWIRHAARYYTDDIPQLADWVRHRFPTDLDRQLTLLESIRAGRREQGDSQAADLGPWALELAGRLLNASSPAAADWANDPVLYGVDNNPWVLQQRSSADGEGGWFLSSLPRGEQRTGRLTSRTFVLPEHLSFFLAGHVGPPGQPVRKDNVVRLRNARTHRVLQEVTPPRNDVAQRIDWKLGGLAGQEAYLEIVDADAGNAYAWLAIGRLEPNVVPWPELDPPALESRLAGAARLIQHYQLRTLLPLLTKSMLTVRGAASQIALAQARLSFLPSVVLESLAPLLGDPALDRQLRDELIAALANSDTSSSNELLEKFFRRYPQPVQLEMAMRLTTRRDGVLKLFEQIAQGNASAQLLRTPALAAQIDSHGQAWAEKRQATARTLPPMDVKLRERLVRLAAVALPSQGSTNPGRLVFEQNCAGCHQRKGQGRVVGPQLDGIEKRGRERVLEDILFPNQNVDVAFRTTLFQTESGRVVSGLLRRQQGTTVVIADPTGREIILDDAEIVAQKSLTVSLMPDNFGEQLTDAQLLDLWRFLSSP